jgi:hypothetical protein
VPIVGILGLLALFSVLVMVVLTNPIGRVAGPIWVVLGLLFYVGYRRYRRLPILQSIQRNWSEQQLEVYEESGETALADEYRTALRRAGRRPGTKPPH